MEGPAGLVGWAPAGFDAALAAERLVAWLRTQVAEAGASGVVVGLSGGVDSAVTAALCARAFPGATLGLILPCHSDPRDAADARAVAARFGIETREVDLGPVYDAMRATLGAADGGAATAARSSGPTTPARSVGAAAEPGPADAASETPRADERAGSEERDRLADANLKPRLRMMALYHFATRRNALVVGTGNRSELAIGYFTKYGDGGVDLLPLGNQVKGEVYALARHLDVPASIVARPPSAGLWGGQTDEGEMGLRYETLDRYLITGEAPPEVRERIERLARRSAHKRQLPPLPPAWVVEGEGAGF